jgi:hypothetical protein
MKVIRISASLLIVLVIGFSAINIVGAKDNGCENKYPFNFTLEFEPGYWTPGSHSYEMKITTGPFSPDEYYNEFEATVDVSPIKGQVQLRPLGLTSIDGDITKIHPSQDTVMQATWGAIQQSRKEMVEIRSQTIMQFRWDGGDWVTVYPGPVTSYCASDIGNFMRSWGNPK